MNSLDIKIKKKYKNSIDSPLNKIKKSKEDNNNEILFKIDNPDPQSYREEKNINKLSQRNNENSSNTILNNKKNLSSTSDLKNLSSKIKSQFKNPLKKGKNSLIENYNNSISIQKFNNTTSKKLPRRALEEIKILQNLIKFNFELSQKKEYTDNYNKNKSINLNIISVNNPQKNNNNEKERKYKTIKVKFKKIDNSSHKNYKSLSKERDKRKALHNVIFNEDKSNSLNHLNLKLNSIINNFNNMQSINLNIKSRKKLSSSMIELNSPKCGKLINKIRSQKKIREILQS
jgi:hypothetical protein